MTSIKAAVDFHQSALLGEILLLPCMFINTIEIAPDTLISNIVRQNHHTADVFLKYEIEYCCGGNWPLETVCLNKGLAYEEIKKELERSSRMLYIQPTINFDSWTTDFLINYIINIHHQFLRTSLQATQAILQNFAEGHQKKYPAMLDVANLFQKIQPAIIPHLDYEEGQIFPYIRQMVHAYDNKDSYAKLLVKTLRKPLNDTRIRQEKALFEFIPRIRALTNNYIIPEKSCTSHGILLCRLKDLDNDLMQHYYLENEVLYSRALRIEAELLN